MIHTRFKTYFRENFFTWKDEEFQDFLTSLEKPIKRSIRIKPDKIETVKKNLETDGWILENTDIRNVFLLDRREDFAPLERRIGYTLDHLIGNFYIQELAAAHPVDILTDGKINDTPLLILDMASSPGGKTTQLAEQFPNSFIVANEPTRERIPQLLQNLERMNTPNVWVTLYPGQFWKGFPETFDRILLDAPCSGEWTLYKWTDATKHWHIKNIKNIAHLQEKLLDAAVHALKVSGEMIYSTCSLNKLENEEVVEKIFWKYPETLEIVFQKKFWPHIDKTGWFFITKIRKKKSIEWKGEREETHSNTEIKKHRSRIEPWKEKDGITLYEHENKVLAIKWADRVSELQKKVFFMRFGEKVWYIREWKFSPTYTAHRCLENKNSMESVYISDEWNLDLYLRGYPIKSDWNDWYVEILYKNQSISLEERKNNIVSNNLPTEWKRK
jgi:16S rRNA (cytosine1407-C5)-methyltransferase